MIDNKRIAKNTLFLYFRMILTMGVSLYTVRVVLNVLGVVDFGIYHAVAGLVMLFSFLSGAMGSASQRYFSHALGQGDAALLRSVFSVNILIYAAIAVLALLALESVGLWFVHQHLVIPTERFDAALAVYHLAAFTLVAQVFISPFNAMIIAHEDMHLYAYLSIFDAVVRLLAVLALPSLPGEKLIVYGSLMLGLSVLNTLLYFLICRRRYAECQLRHFSFDRNLAKEIVGFTGWTLFGSLTTVGRNQAITILLNQFFNPVVVAARVIAVSIASKANLLSQNFNVGLYPPIIKSYAAGERQEMYNLIFNGSKITFFLMWLLALPLFMEMEALMVLWLGEAPPYAVLFARLALVETILMAISHPLATAARAPGKMALYEGTLGSMQLLIFFGAWLVLHLGGPAEAVFVVAIAVNGLMFFTRLWLVHRLIQIPAMEFLSKVAVPVGIVVCASVVPAGWVHMNVPQNLVGHAISIAACGVITVVTVYFLGLDGIWRAKTNDLVQARIRRIFKLA